MVKKKSWFARVKGLFFAAKDEHKDQLKKKKKRGLFGWMRTTKKPPSLAAPSLSRDRTEINARKQVAHQDLLVADPAASEAAMACSTTAARYPGLSLPTSSSSTRQCEDHLAAKILLHRAQLVRHVEHLAAIKIQTAFRGYLARKALRALKGLVRLQAMIRGRAVRRQAVATLKSLQSIVNIQSQVCATRYQKASETKQSEDPRYVKMKIGQSIQRRRDHTLLMKDEENAILLSKTEAMMQRNRLKAYSFNHRHSADVEDGKMLGRLRRWLEEYEEYEVPMKEEIKKVDSIAGKQLMRLRSAQHHQASEIVMAPRKSFEGKKHRAASQSVDKIDAKPAYMAATESARARVRSMSSARLVRPMQLESYSDGDSPYKSKISLMSSMKSERSCIGGALVASGSYLRHRSCTGRRGIGGSMRLNRNMTDSGPENGRWLLDWN